MTLPHLYLDTETYRFGPANKAPRPVCISTACGPAEPRLEHCAWGETWEHMQAALAMAARRRRARERAT